MVWFVSTRKTRWYHYYSCNFENEKVIREKKLFHSKQLFWLWWPLEAKRLTLGQIWRHCNATVDPRSNLTACNATAYNGVMGNVVMGNLLFLSNTVFGFVISIRVPEIMEVFRSDARHSRKKLENFAFFAPGGHIFDPIEKRTEIHSFDWVFDDLSNAACGISLQRSGAELDGGVKTPPGPLCYNRSTGPARVNPRPTGGLFRAPLSLSCDIF